MTPQWVSPETAANFLGVSTKDLHRYFKDVTMPHIKLTALPIR